MAVFKRGNVWWIDYYSSGIRRRERVGKDGIITKGMAQSALRARLGEIAQGRYSLDRAKKPIVFEKLVERFWNTQRQINAHGNVTSVLQTYFSSTSAERS